MRATAQWCGVPLEPSRCVLIDIDGVLSDASGRQHHLNNPEGKRDWPEFFRAAGDDQPLTAVPALLALLDPSLVLVLLSARPTWVFQITVDWLGRHEMRWDLLILRGDADPTDAVDFKRDVLFELRSMGWDVALAIDDDERIIAMYVAEQQPALYIHSGYYASDSRG